MFSVNDKVNYSVTGVCNIEDIVLNEISNEKKQFYVLKSIFALNTTVMVPTDNELLVSRMRPIIAKKEAEYIIENQKNIEPIWIDDDRQRPEEFKNILIGTDRNKIFAMLKALYIHQNIQHKKGRKLRSNDERIMYQAEKMLFGELAFVLDTTVDEISKIIKQNIQY